MFFRVVSKLSLKRNIINADSKEEAFLKLVEYSFNGFEFSKEDQTVTIFGRVVSFDIVENEVQGYSNVPAYSYF